MSWNLRIFERAGASRKVTWVSVVGVILLPLLIVSLLVWSLWNPNERLEQIHGAIVNQDDPVTIEGQMVPMGRQLTAGIIGSDEPNFEWTITDAEDAEAGLRNGSYTAVITIPDNFSAAVTSAAEGPDQAEQATISVLMSEQNKVMDDAISALIAQTAATLFGQEITTQSLENVFLGFNTIGEQLGTAADAAQQIDDGASQLADGAGELANGTGELASGADQLADGAGVLAQGVRELSNGLDPLSAGASSLSDGLNTAHDGSKELAEGMAVLSDGVETLAQGIQAVVDEIEEALDGELVPPEIIAALEELGSPESLEVLEYLASGVPQVQEEMQQSYEKLVSLVLACDASGASGQFCDSLREVSVSFAGITAAAVAYMQTAEEALSGLATLGEFAPEIKDAITEGQKQIDELRNGLDAFNEGVQALSVGAAEAATGTASLADGLGQLADGADQLAGGLKQANTGAGQLADGAQTLSDGMSELAQGSSTLAEGSSSLADGTSELSDGMGELATGLGEAVDAIPSYSESERKNLSQVMAAPIQTENPSGINFGPASVPFALALALWLGALTMTVIVRVLPERVEESTRSALSLALGVAVPLAFLGAVQGLVAATLLQFMLNLSLGTWFGFAFVTMLSGITFNIFLAMVVSWLRGIAWFVSALAAALILATGLISTAPEFLGTVLQIFPVAPAMDAIRGVLYASGGVAGAAVVLFLWLAFSFALYTLGFARRRRVTAKRVQQVVQMESAIP